MIFFQIAAKTIKSLFFIHFLEYRRIQGHPEWIAINHLLTKLERKKADALRPPFGLLGDSGYSGRSSLNVRCPEIMVETIDCRLMMSSRMAA